MVRCTHPTHYFPPPSQPWQRGSNENTNGLLREYFPKQQDIGQWDNQYIQTKVAKLNLRPRKCLDWRTPYEVYYQKVLQLVWQFKNIFKHGVIVFALSLFAVSTAHAKSENLPFVGSDVVNWLGGNATNEFITIKKNGTVTIISETLDGNAFYVY